MQEPHRAGNLKQKNKRHKTGKHRSKGEINAQCKGKLAIKISTQRAKFVQNKVERRNHAQQLRQKKREEVLEKKRRIGSETSPPFLTAIVPLGFSPIPEKLLDLIISADLDSTVSCSRQNVFHLNVKRWKQRFSFIIPPRGDLISTLDAVKVSDSVIFLVSAQNKEVIDEPSEKILTCLLTQGLPATSVVTVDMESIAPNKKHGFKLGVQKVLSRWLPNEKVISVEYACDTVTLLRRLGNQKQRIIFQREIRPYLLIEDAEFDNPSNSEFGTLKVSGYLRGQPLSVNSLVHLPGWGDFQMLRIDSTPDPHVTGKNIIDRSEVLAIADPEKQVSLDSLNVPDPMDAEQNWPTEEEMEMPKSTLKKVIKGTSNYQACWIPDDDDDDEGSENDCKLSEGDDVDMVVESEEDCDSDHWEDCGEQVDFPAENEPDKYDKTVNFHEELDTLQKIKDAREEYTFPDEVDTPRDEPARERFCKYRGLASFRTSPWDPKENLPQDYGRIFQFENFDRSRRKILKTVEDQMDGIPPGGYLTLHIKNVSSKLFEEKVSSSLMVLCGLLPHEQKMSVINFVVKRSTQPLFYQLPIKSKDPVVVHCGFRRYRSRPIYSQHTNGSKHKYERFFQPDTTAVATVYAPITFPPSPVLLFTDSGKSLVATGRVLSVDPDRLIIKRVILSGHPFRVLKHSAIIRFMFFNREDILWFKPIELRTKYGRRGHIKEPLGTHGHMKAVFDDQLKSQDTVLMDLYKRVFPPWFYETSNLSHSQLYNFVSLIPKDAENSMELCEKN